MKKDGNKTAILRFRVPAAVEQAMAAEARRLHMHPHEIARFALARGLAVLADDGGQVGMEGMSHEQRC